MKTPQQLGLIVQGNVTKSVVLRYASLVENIGPVKASALSVAHRAADFIRAGTPVDNYEAFETCDLVLLRLPDASVPQVVKELSQSKLKLNGISFLLCESWLPSEVLAPLKSRGATVATMLAVSSSSNQWFVLEGEYTAVKRSKKLLNNVDANVVEFKPGSKYLYFAASAFAETLPRALFATAQRALRKGGISGHHLHALLQEMAENMFHDISRGARAGWTGPLLDCPEEIAADYLIRLQQNSPGLAAFLSEHLKLAEPFLAQRMKPRIKKTSHRREPTHSETTLHFRKADLPNSN